MDSENLKSRGVELLNISVEIAPGHKDNLRVFEHDDPKFIVRKFFIKNNITNHDERALVQKVNDLIKELIQEHEIINMTLANRPLLNSKSCKNYGEKLYRKSLHEREVHLVNNQMKRIISAKKIEEAVVGRPSIDKNSVKIVSASVSKNTSINRIQSPRDSITADEVPFTPRVNRKSEIFVKKIKENCDSLVKEKKKVKSRLITKAKGEVSFKPKSLNTAKKGEMEKIEEKPRQIQSSNTGKVGKLKEHLYISVEAGTGLEVFSSGKVKAPRSCRNSQNVQEFHPGHQKVSSAFSAKGSIGNGLKLTVR